MICNLEDPMSFRHPVVIDATTDKRDQMTTTQETDKRDKRLTNVCQ